MLRPVHLSYNAAVQRRLILMLTLSILAVALMGSSCEFAASVNNSVPTDREETAGRADEDRDGGLVIVVRSGNLDDERSLGQRSISAAEGQVATPLVEELAPSAVPLLTPWGFAFLTSFLGIGAHLALRNDRRHH